MPQTAMNGQIDGHAVAAARHVLGLSQVAVAASAGVTQAYLSQIESGKRTRVGDAILTRLAAALDVDPDALRTQPTAAGVVLTAEEAAAQLLVTPTKVRQMCRGGELRAARVGRQWRIRQVEVDRLLTPQPAAS